MLSTGTYDKKTVTASERARKKRKAKRRRRRNSVFFYAVMLTLLITAVAIASLTVFFNIREIKVNGTSKYTSEDVIAASGIKIGQNMFRLNKFKVQTEIEEKLPYISKATINRRLPDILEVNITPAEEYVFIGMGTGYIILDKDFKSLDQVAALEEGRTEVRNVKLKEYTPGKKAVFEKEETAALIKTVIDSLKAAEILNKANYIDFAKSYDIIFGYENRLECHIGNTEKLDLKLLMIKNAVASNPLTDNAVINVTDPYKLHYIKKN